MAKFKGHGDKRPNFYGNSEEVALGGLPSGDISNYINYLQSNGYTPQEVQGFSQGLNSGNQGIQNWIEQYNTDPLNADKQILQPKTEEEIALAKQGQFNNFDNNQNQQAQAARETLFNKIINGVNDFSAGYKENRNTPFDPQNLAPNGNENFMTRAGEFMGSASRIANTPAGQAIIAGLATAATGGGMSNAIQNAYKFGSERAKTNAYADQLKKLGIDYTPTLLSNLSAQDAAAMAKPVYEQWSNEIAKQKLDETQRYHDLMNQLYLDRLEETKKYHEDLIADKKEKNKIQREKTQIQKQKASSGRGRKYSKPQDNPNWGNDLAVVNSVLNDSRISPENKQKAVNDFIREHKTDPRKHLAKNTSSKNGNSIATNDAIASIMSSY